MTARFYGVVADFRLTLECEALRRGRPPVDGDIGILRWEEDIAYLKPLLLNPHPAQYEGSLYNNLIESAKLPGYLPANYPLLTP